MVFAFAILGLTASRTEPMEQKKLDQGNRASASLKLLSAYQLAKNKSSFALERLKIPSELRELISCVKQHQLDLEQGNYFNILQKIAHQQTSNTHFLKELETFLDADFYASEEKKSELLLIAATHGNNNLIDWLINHGAEVDGISTQNNRKGNTALMAATAQNNIPTVQLLIKHGANVNKENKFFGHSPLQIATFNRNISIFNLLIEHNAKIKNGFLCDAAYYGCNALIERLLELGASMEEQDTIYGATPLLNACMGGHINAINLLIEYGANMNALDNAGRSAFMIAASITDNQKRENILELLQEHGAQNQINMLDQDGRTSLMLAMHKMNPYLVRYLLQKNALCNLQDASGRTVLTYYLYAVEDGDWYRSDVKAAEAKEILKLLIKNNAPIDQRNAQGQTPLVQAVTSIYAFRSGVQHFIKTLLDAGADINSQDNQGKTALDYALASGEDSLIKLLLQYKPHISSTNRFKLLYHNHQKAIIGTGALVLTGLAGWYMYKNSK